MEYKQQHEAFGVYCEDWGYLFASADILLLNGSFICAWFDTAQ